MKLKRYDHRKPDECHVQRCRQESDEVVHLDGDRVEVCERHLPQAYAAMTVDRRPEQRAVLGSEAGELVSPSSGFDSRTVHQQLLETLDSYGIETDEQLRRALGNPKPKRKSRRGDPRQLTIVEMEAHDQEEG